MPSSAAGLGWRCWARAPLPPPPPLSPLAACIGVPKHNGCSFPCSRNCYAAGKSSAGGSEHDSESLCSREDLGSRASGGRRGSGARDRDEDYEELEVDPFDTAVEQLYEKRCGTGWQGSGAGVQLVLVCSSCCSDKVCTAAAPLLWPAVD